MALPTTNTPDRAPQRRIGFALSIVTLVGGGLVTLVLTPLYTRFLGPAEFGVYGLALSVAALIAMLPNTTASIYLHFHWKVRRSGGWGAVASLNSMFLAMSLCGLVLSLVAAVWLVQPGTTILTSGLTAQQAVLARYLSAVLSLNVGMTFVFSFFESSLLADERFILLRLIGIGRQIIGPLLFIPALLTLGTSQSLVWITVLVNAVTGAVSIVAVLRRPGRTFASMRGQLQHLVPMLRFGSFALVGAVIYQIYWNIDRVIVAGYWGAEEVGVLTVALQIATIFMLLSTSVSNVFAPLVNEYASDTNPWEKIGALFVRVGRYEAILIGLVLVEFLVIGRDFVSMWLGPNYEAAFVAAAVLMVGGFWPFVQSLGLDILKARNLHYFRTGALVVGAAAKIVLSLTLVARWGVVGGAMGTALALVVFDGVALNWYYGRRLGLPMRAFWGAIAPILAAVLGAVALGTLLNVLREAPSTILFLAMQALTSGGFFLVACWFFAVNPEERGSIIALVRRVVRRGSSADGT